MVKLKNNDISRGKEFRVSKLLASSSGRNIEFLTVLCESNERRLSRRKLISHKRRISIFEFLRSRFPSRGQFADEPPQHSTGMWEVLVTEFAVNACNYLSASA